MVLQAMQQQRQVAEGGAATTTGGGAAQLAATGPDGQQQQQQHSNAPLPQAASPSPAAGGWVLYEGVQGSCGGGAGMYVCR